MTSVTYRRAVGAVDAVVDGQTVLLSPRDLSYHSLDRVGACVWDLLSEPQTVDRMVDSLQASFNVTEEQCRADLEPFLARMTAIGILEESAA
jgi:hypothetical protein